jgi:uncharacterized protein
MRGVYHPQCMEPSTIIARTQHWLEKAVIGLNLCPFAKAEHVHGRIRYALSEATDETQLLLNLEQELEYLRGSNPEKTETTLLIHPQALQDFFDYNQFLDAADALLVRMKLSGTIQIASFHPHYQFAGTQASDIENYSNRSPYPMLHLLREASVARAVQSVPDAASIFERNIQTLRSLGHAGWAELMP